MSDKCYRFSSRDDTSFRCGCGEGSGLPIVTAEDDGKVLGVSNGQWIAGEFGNGLPSTKSSDILSESFSTNDLISMGTMYGTTYHYETQLDTSDYILTDGNQYVVTFNGTDYILTATAASGTHSYLGELDDGTLAINYDNYPFWITERDDHKLEVWIPEEEEDCSVEIKQVLIGDNNVLITRNGEWTAGEFGQGSSVLQMLDITFDGNPANSNVESNITAGELADIVAAGKVPCFYYTWPNNQVFFYILSWCQTTNTYTFVFNSSIGYSVGSQANLYLTAPNRDANVYTYND